MTSIVREAGGDGGARRRTGAQGAVIERLRGLVLNSGGGDRGEDEEDDPDAEERGERTERLAVRAAAREAVRVMLGKDANDDAAAWSAELADNAVGIRDEKLGPPKEPWIVEMR